MVKRKPHHPLDRLKKRFDTVAALEISRTAFASATALGYDLDGIVGVIGSIHRAAFRKAETAHHPKNSKVWHDTYHHDDGSRILYLKFAGETADDAVLVSFKELIDE